MKRVAVIAIALCALVPFVVTVAVAAALARAASPKPRSSGAIAAIDGVDPAVLQIVNDATAIAIGQRPGCDADPILVLAHMSIEWPPGLEGQGRGASMAANGDFYPIIQAYAPVPGADTDGGRYDGSATAEYAVGPLQQINAFRVSHSFDGNNDGVIDQNSLADATAMEIIHACGTRETSGLSLQTPEGRHYEAGHYMLPAAPTSPAAADYGRTVEAAYQRLRASAHFAGPARGAGSHVLPVDPSLIKDQSVLLAKHHDFPSWDFPIPTGTTAYAATSGKVVAAGWSGDCGIGVTFDGDDGARYTYCHGIEILVVNGQHVGVGDPLLLTGSTGNSTGPHLHFQIQFAGRLVCPQPLLVAWAQGADADPKGATGTGCFY